VLSVAAKMGGVMSPVAGTWRYADGRVELTEFDPLPHRVRRSAEEAAKVLAAFHR
jgi:hypothetical protein